MAFPSPKIGETIEVGCTFKERTGQSFTITEALLDIQTSSGSYIREAVTALIDGDRTYYVETFTTANGYAGGSTYTVTFTASITVGDSSYTEIYEDSIYVLGSGSVVYMADLVDMFRTYIEDNGESVSRNVIGMPDGTRTTFRLHHNNIDQNNMDVTVNGTAVTAYTIDKNVITFTTAPTLNAAIVVDYIYYEYPADVLEMCVKKSVSDLNNAIDMGWGEYNGNSWVTTSTDLQENLVLTGAVLNFLCMQIVRLPVALSFGDFGARISFRGAGMERQRAIQEVKSIYYRLIDEYNISNLQADIIN